MHHRIGEWTPVETIEDLITEWIAERRLGTAEKIVAACTNEHGVITNGAAEG